MTLNERLKQARKEAGFQFAKEAARAFGWNENTYSSHENGNRGFPSSAGEKYAKNFGVDFNWLMTGRGSPKKTGNTSDEFHGIDINTGQPIREGVRMVTVKGYVQAGHFADNQEWPQDRWYTVPVPNDPEFQNVNLYGAETKGPSMNKRYSEGSIVVFTSIYETEEEVVPGRRYIVEKIDGAEYEKTVKTLHQDKDGRNWLLPESTDPLFQEPYELKENGEQEVRVVGRVVWHCSKE